MSAGARSGAQRGRTDVQLGGTRLANAVSAQSAAPTDDHAGDAPGLHRGKVHARDLGMRELVRHVDGPGSVRMGSTGRRVRTALRQACGPVDDGRTKDRPRFPSPAPATPPYRPRAPQATAPARRARRSSSPRAQIAASDGRARSASGSKGRGGKGGRKGDPTS